MKSHSKSIFATAIIVIAIIATSIYWKSEKKEDSKKNQKTEITTKYKEDRKLAKNQKPEVSKVTSYANSGSKKAIRLTPQDAKGKLEDFFSANTNIDERSKYASEIIASLCRAGYSREAWDLIDPNYGQVRNSQLATYFLSSSIPSSELLAKIPSVENSELSTCLSSYFMRFGPGDIQKVLNSGDLEMLTNKLGPRAKYLNISSAVSSSIQIALLEGDPAKSPEIIKNAVSMFERNYLNADDFLGIINKEQSISSFDAWSMIKAMDYSQWNRSAINKRAELIDKMVIEDPEKALNLIGEGEWPGKKQDYSNAIGKWTTVDPASATQWYIKNKGNLSLDNQKLIASGFALEAAQSYEFESAASWAREISDPTLRQETLKKIEEYSQQHKPTN